MHSPTGSTGSSSASGARACSREEDVDEVLREIRVALLEADVNFKVVRGMLDRIRERAVGVELSEALNPAQQVIKIVHEELINDPRRRDHQDHLRLASRPPSC